MSISLTLPLPGTAIFPSYQLHHPRPVIVAPSFDDEHFTPPPTFDFPVPTTTNSSTTTQVAPKYAPWETVFIATATAITAIVTVLGNILVLVSFVVERALRQPSNFFIASLAVTDLLIGLFSMPAYSSYLLLEYWPLPNFLCDLWLSLDYTVCLVSQYNVLLITIDRFCSVKIPAKYRNWRTKRKVQIMIIATWIVPSSIFFTIHLGWDTIVNGGVRKMEVGSCDAQYIKGYPTFNVVLIFSYFWVTMVVLLILYAGIYQTAFSLQRKSQAKHEKMQQMVRLGSRATGKDQKASRQSGAFLAVNSLKPPNHDVSVVFNSLTVTQGRTMETVMEITTPQKSTGDSGSTEPERSSSPSFPSDAEQNGENGGQPPAVGVHDIINRHKKPPARGGTNAAAGRHRPRVFHELRQKAAQRNSKDRGRIELIVPKSQPPPKLQIYSDSASIVELTPRDDCDLVRSSLLTANPKKLLPASTAGGVSSVSCYLPVAEPIQEKDPSPAPSHVLSVSTSYPTINTSTLQTILLAKELNEEIRQLFAQRTTTLPNSLSSTPLSAEPVWIPRVPFPVRFDEQPSGILLPFTGQTPLNQTADWRFIDQESLKSPNPSLEGTPSNRSSFSSPLVNRRGTTPSLQAPTPPRIFTPKSSIKSSKRSSPVSHSPPSLLPTATPNGGLPPLIPTLKIIRPAPRVSIRPEVSDIGEESTRHESERSVYADNDQAPLANNFAGGPGEGPQEAQQPSRNNSERLRSFGRRIRQVAARGSKRKSINKRQQSRSENRARKALKTITFIMGAFMLCWIPWHILATIEGFCNGCVPTDLYAVSYWLCYLNSPINPFCYALANQQFKKTFIRILNRDLHRT